MNIKHNSSLSCQDCYDKVLSFLDYQTELKKYDPKLEICQNPNTKTFEIIGSKITGTAKIKENGSGSEVMIDLKLNWMLKPFKALIEEKIQNELKSKL